MLMEAIRMCCNTGWVPYFITDADQLFAYKQITVRKYNIKLSTTAILRSALCRICKDSYRFLSPQELKHAHKDLTPARGWSRSRDCKAMRWRSQGAQCTWRVYVLSPTQEQVYILKLIWDKKKKKTCIHFNVYPYCQMMFDYSLCIFFFHIF